ncbi:MAG: fimbrillin family protein, partial [Odoribacteraceae bacterium]|nr:fimbrillin family protein [Odoribacteraceae bacterium]
MKTRTSIMHYFPASLVGALICAATVVSCVKAAGNLPLVTPGEGRAAIVPVAGVTAARASSRGDLSSGPVTGSAFPANTSKLFAVTAYAGPAATPPANVPQSTAYFDNQAVGSDPESKLSFTDPQYYPPSSDVKLYFYAYSPLIGGTYTPGNGSTVAPAVTWDLDGQQDVMYASVTSGIGKEEGTQTHPEFGFQHLLARVQFKLVQGTGFGGGINVTEINLNALNTRASLDLVTGALTWTHR